MASVRPTSDNYRVVWNPKGAKALEDAGFIVGVCGYGEAGANGLRTHTGYLPTQKGVDLLASDLQPAQ